MEKIHGIKETTFKFSNLMRRNKQRKKLKILMSLLKY